MGYIKGVGKIYQQTGIDTYSNVGFAKLYTEKTPITAADFYKVAFRKKLYKSLEEIQADLDKYMDRYNNDRTNQGKRCQGRTPRQTLDAGYEHYKKYVIM